MLFVTMSFAQQTETVNKKIYQNVEIEKFTIRTGVEFPADKIDALTNVVAGELRETKRFNQVSIAGDAVAQPATETVDLSTMKITGEVVKFDKGNRAMRYIVGMGTGKTKIIVNVKFIDAKTGETMMEQIVDGDISKGIFGGNTSDARSEVADEIVKIMKRNFTEDKKKKSK
jgi:hypothetical protein